MWHLTFALAFSGAAALTVTPRILPRSLTTLGARQSVDPSQFPPACQMPCGPVITDLSACTTNACTCTTKVAGDYQTCLNCLGELAVSSGINNASVNAEVENAVTTFNQQCASAALPPITAPPGISATSGGSLGGGLSATGSQGAFPSTGLPTGGGIPTGSVQGPSFGTSSLGGAGGGGVGGGGAGSLPLATQTAATLPPAGGVGVTATSSGLLSGTAGAKPSAGYKDASARLVMVAVGLIGAAVPYLC